MYNVEMPLTTESDTSQEIPFNDYHKCTLLESRTTIESGATGLRTWSASFILADYLVSHRGKHVRSNAAHIQTLKLDGIPVSYEKRMSTLCVYWSWAQGQGS